MSNLNLLKDMKVDRVMNAVAAGTSAQNSSVLDMQGYDSVCFILLLGEVLDTAVITLTAKGNTASSVSSPTPLAYTEAVATWTADATNADNKVLAVDVQKPRERYVFANVTRTTANVVIDGIIAVRYNGANVPLTTAVQAGLLASASLNDPTGV